MSWKPKVSLKYLSYYIYVFNHDEEGLSFSLSGSLVSLSLSLSLQCLICLYRSSLLTLNKEKVTSPLGAGCELHWRGN